MPNLAMIIPSVASDRSHHPHKYKCQFTEGDAKDYFYVAPEFLTIFLVHDSYGVRDICAARRDVRTDRVSSEDFTVADYTNTDAYKEIRRYQRDTWMAHLHEEKVRLHDGSFDDAATPSETHMTFDEQLSTIIALSTVSTVYNPAATTPKLLKCKTAVPKSFLESILGFDTWRATASTELSFKRPAIEFCMAHAVPDASVMSTGTLYIESHMPYAKYNLTLSDIEGIISDFTRQFSILRSGTECDCGCEFSVGPGTKFVAPGCGHKYSESCYTVWRASSRQDPRDIHLNASDCPMGCVSCLQDPIEMESGRRLWRSDLSDAVVAASSSNCIAMCSACTLPNIIYPRSCSTHMEDDTMRCEACSDQSYWKCPTEGCELRHEHVRGCRWLRCCPVHTSFDVPCPGNCKFTLIGEFGNEIARGCGQEYKMKDGLVQDGGAGAAASDGSYYG
jgi:hypothetical protein